MSATVGRSLDLTVELRDVNQQHWYQSTFDLQYSECVVGDSIALRLAVAGSNTERISNSSLV